MYLRRKIVQGEYLLFANTRPVHEFMLFRNNAVLDRHRGMLGLRVMGCELVVWVSELIEEWAATGVRVYDADGIRLA